MSYQSFAGYGYRQKVIADGVPWVQSNASETSSGRPQTTHSVQQRPTSVSGTNVLPSALSVSRRARRLRRSTTPHWDAGLCNIMMSDDMSISPRYSHVLNCPAQDFFSRRRARPCIFSQDQNQDHLFDSSRARLIKIGFKLVRHNTYGENNVIQIKYPIMLQVEAYCYLVQKYLFSRPND